MSERKKKEWRNIEVIGEYFRRFSQCCLVGTADLGFFAVSPAEKKIGSALRIQFH